MIKAYKAKVCELYEWGQFDVLLMKLVVKRHVIRRNQVKKMQKKETYGYKRIIREKDAKRYY